MGFFFGGGYKVVRITGWFGGEETVLEDVSLAEAQQYIDSRSGFFSGDGYSYKIVKMW